jgi:hypothetical protein
MAWEKLTEQEQQVLLDLLQQAAEEIHNEYEEELTRLQQIAAKGSMLARRDGAGIARQPVPPVPDVKRDASYEKLVLDTHPHLSAQGFDIGVVLLEDLASRTDALPAGRIKAAATVMEQAARASYTQLYTRAVTVFPERAMQRLLEWDEQSRQQDSWLDRLRRMLGEP